MKTKFLQRVLWLMIPLLTMFNISAWGTLPANPTWTATALSDIADDATIIIMSSSNHALPSTTTSSSPAKISCTISTTNGISTITPGSGTLQNLAWTVDKLASSWKFYQEGSATVHLYLSGTGSNTALRVGTGSSNDQFVMGNMGRLLKVTTATRFVGPYSAGSDWRTYNTENAGNYNNATLTFYVLNSGGGGGTVATPTFSPAAGTYNNNQSVTINCGTAGATIYYTTDGSTPTTSSSVYSSAITVSSDNTTIKALATKSGMTNSSVGSATYRLTCATPTISPAAGSFCGSEDVTLSCTTNGATIRYTTNGNTPTESSSAYSSAIHLTSTTTIKAKAFKSGYTASAETSAAYTTNPLTTMDAIYAAATNSEVSTCITFNNWIISGVSRDGKNVYLTDGTKGLIIYNSGGNSGFAVGNILSGTATCSLKKYNQSAELVGLTSSTSGLSVTTGGSVSPITVDASDISALTGVNTGCVITTTGVCGTCNTDKQCINGAQLYNQLYLYTTPTNGTTYTVTGVYLQYGATQEILPLSNLTTFTITAQSNNNSYGTVSVSNGVITATPASGYRVSTTTAYTISPAGSATVTDNGDNTFTVTPSANTTITINFELIPTYTVTWSVSGNTTSYPATTGVVGGTTTTAPTVSPSPCGTFMGWTTAANASYSDPSTPPTPLFTGTTPTITDNVTFYAVFADEDE